MKEILSILFKEQPDGLGRKAEIVFSGLLEFHIKEFIRNRGNNVSYGLFMANMRSYFIKLSIVPEKNVLLVPMLVGVPIIKRFEYIDQPELINIHINLLLKASIKETSNHVLPSFIHMADRLSEDEARIIKYFYSREYIPFINFRKLIERKIGYNEFVNRLTGIEFDLELKNPDNLGLYFENFSSIGLLYTSWGYSKEDDDIYKRLIDNYLKMNPEINKLLVPVGATDEIIKGYFNFTELGKRFVELVNCE